VIDTRIFTFGLGKKADFKLLNKISKTGRGYCSKLPQFLAKTVCQSVTEAVNRSMYGTYKNGIIEWKVKDTTIYKAFVNENGVIDHKQLFFSARIIKKD
jgi:hypothetical protein